jgi:hypothetical protein
VSLWYESTKDNPMVGLIVEMNDLVSAMSGRQFSPAKAQGVTVFRIFGIAINRPPLMPIERSCPRPKL